MATSTEDVPPGLDERYIGATNSSNLRLNPDAQCDATHLIASGLIGNRMGQALLHLRAEWDSADKPRKATESDVHTHAATLPKRKDKPDLKRARGVLLVAYAGAMRARAHQMHGWPVALGIMREWAQARGVDPDLLSPALYHHLNPTCPVCDGHGKIRMEDAPVLGKTCYYCNGAGEWAKPMAADTIHEWLKRCAGKAKATRSAVLRGDIDSDDMRDRKARRVAPAAEDERGAEAVAAVALATMEKAPRERNCTADRKDGARCSVRKTLNRPSGSCPLRP